MRRLTTRDPPADSGSPLESDLQQMADDGCPLGMDPALLANAHWRDNLGECDTFEDEMSLDLPTGKPDVRQGASVRVESHPAAVWTAPRSRNGEVCDS